MINKKEHIIKAGMELFVKQGFENTPTSQISKAAKVATGTLFHHFKTKEDLINEIYVYVKESMSKALFKDLDTTSSLKEQIKTLWMNLMKWGFENKSMNLFLSRFYGSTYISGLTVEQTKSAFEPSVKILFQAKKEKIIKDISLTLLENLTMSIFQSFLTEFYESKKLDNKKLELSFGVYWDTIKR